MVVQGSPSYWDLTTDIRTLAFMNRATPNNCVIYIVGWAFTRILPHMHISTEFGYMVNALHGGWVSDIYIAAGWSLPHRLPCNFRTHRFTHRGCIYYPISIEGTHIIMHQTLFRCRVHEYVRPRDIWLMRTQHRYVLCLMCLPWFKGHLTVNILIWTLTCLSWELEKPKLPANSTPSFSSLSSPLPLSVFFSLRSLSFALANVLIWTFTFLSWELEKPKLSANSTASHSLSLLPSSPLSVFFLPSLPLPLSLPLSPFACSWHKVQRRLCRQQDRIWGSVFWAVHSGLSDPEQQIQWVGITTIHQWYEFTVILTLCWLQLM
jgi:hypothetical protein